MTLPGRIVWGVIGGIGLSVLVRHHTAYLFRSRAVTFGAFLATAGWLIMTLVALAALGFGLSDPGTRTVEVAVGIVGLVCIAVGRRLT